MISNATIKEVGEMNYELRRINIRSLLKPIPLIFVITGFVMGLFTFFFFPAPAVQTLGGGTRFLSYIIFVILYTVIMEAMVLFFAWLYNLISPKTKGIVFHLEQK